MRINEIVQRMFYLFFVVLSGLLVASYVFLLLFGHYALGVNDITALLALAILTNLAAFVFYSRRELKREEMLLRYVIHLVFVVGITLATAFFMGWISWQNPLHIAVFTLLMMMVYIGSNAAESFRTKKLVNDLNQKMGEHFKD
jgi:peptidoglycan/LPS O-acetylase OafA/YrhL